MAESRGGGADGCEMDADRTPDAPPSKRPRGRPRTHAYRKMRQTLTVLTTRRLDGRSAVAVAVRRWKEDIRRDRGGDLARAQETILELAAQKWVIVSSLDDYIARQPSLVSKKRQVIPVVMQRMQIAEGLARQLERLGLERVAKDVDDLHSYIAGKVKDGAAAAPDAAPAEAPET